MLNIALIRMILSRALVLTRNKDVLGATLYALQKHVLTHERLGWGAFYLGSIGGCCQSTVNFTVNAKSLSDKELCVILAPTVKILKIDSW